MKKKHEIESGAASLRITLSNGSVVISHGDDDIELARLDNAPAGTWETMWNNFETLGIKRRFK